MNPIRVFYSELTGRFFATRSYRIESSVKGERELVVITGQKFDVTQDIARAITEHGIAFEKAPPNRGK